MAEEKSAAFDTAAYLARINLDPSLAAACPTDLPTLTAVMLSHSLSIPFENLSVVLGETISMAADDVEAKLVRGGRGGYCFEQNTLMQLALASLGYSVRPLLCRVRWGKVDDVLSPLTHIALAVTAPGLGDGVEYLVDVGFAGTNSVAPVLLSGGDAPQALPEGSYRVCAVYGPEGGATSGDSAYTALQRKNRSKEGVEAWASLYMFRTGETAIIPDLEVANWVSCTKPGARFTGQLFVSLCVVTDDEVLTKAYILNDSYVVRTLRASGEDAYVPSTVVTTKVKNTVQLVELLRSVFGLALSEEEMGGVEEGRLGVYLPGGARYTASE